MPPSATSLANAATGVDRPVASDRDLLGRFIDQRDESAFAELIARHGSLVRGVCGRMLGDSSSADDAAQATFFILAYKSRSICGRLDDDASLAPWLHRVAKNSALQVSRSEKTRSRRETMAARVRAESAVHDQADQFDEASPVLDQEIQSLPARYRDPLILCYIEGLTLQDVSNRLGIAYGTLRRRLDDAKDALRSRLAKRGIVVTTLVLAGWLRSLDTHAANHLVSAGASQFLDGWPRSANGLSGAPLELGRNILRRGIRRNVLIGASGGAAIAFTLGFFTVAFTRTKEPPPIPEVVAVPLIGSTIDPKPRIVQNEPAAPPPVIVPRPLADPIPPPNPHIAFHRPMHDFLPEALALGERAISDKAAQTTRRASGRTQGGFFGEMNINGQVKRFNNLAEFQRAQAEMGFGRMVPNLPFGGFPIFNSGGGMLGHPPAANDETKSGRK